MSDAPVARSVLAAAMIAAVAVIAIIVGVALVAGRQGPLPARDSARGAAGGEDRSRESTAAVYELPAIPLERMEPVVRAQFEEAIHHARGGRDADSVGRLGMLAHAYGLHSAAATCYAMAKRDSRRSAAWEYYRGVALAQLGRADDAAAAFSSWLGAQPDDAPAILRLAELDLGRGRFEPALGRFRRVIELRGGAPSPHAHCGAGRALLRLDRAADAAAALETALAQAGDLPYGEAQYLLGQALQRMGRHDEAGAHLGLAARQSGLEPPRDDPMMAAVEALATGAIHARDRGIEHLKAARVQEAIASLEESIRINPGLAETHSQLGAAHLLGDNPERAEQSLRRALAIDPHFVDAAYNLGVIAHRRGDFARAGEQFRTVIEIRPDHFDAQRGLGIELMRLDRPMEAVAHLAAANRLRPLDARPYKQLAAALAAAGLEGEALATLRRGLERLPGDASIADRLARLLATAADERLRDPGEALRLAMHVADVTKRRQPKALDTLAAALAASGRFDEAAAVAGEAATLASDMGDVPLAEEIRAARERYHRGEAPPAGQEMPLEP
jgi:tetratricopeptide (TPR) repeat protein